MNRLIGVHGFGFDPASSTDSPAPLFAMWAQMLGRPVEGFAYYSYPIGPVGLGRAILEGYEGEYHAAFERAAPEAAKMLAARIRGTGSGIDLIGHSLGARVICSALPQTGGDVVRRMLLLEGAELQPNVPRNLPIGVEVLNVCSRDDLVLSRLGSVFNGQAVAPCIGAAGLGRAMPGWIDLCLTNSQVRAAAKAAKGWDFDGTPQHLSLDPIADLRLMGGHWRAYTDPDNAAAYRAWFDGNSFAWLKSERVPELLPVT